MRGQRRPVKFRSTQSFDGSGRCPPRERCRYSLRGSRRDRPTLRQESGRRPWAWPSSGGALALVVALVLIPAPVRARVASVTLRELVDRSDLIVVATVTKVEDGPADLLRTLRLEDPRLPGVKVATAQVVEAWKGIAPREVRYVASPTWVCDISGASVGERVVLFLGKSDDSPFLWIAHTGRGRMPLRDVKGTPHATLWVDDVRLPPGVATIPGARPEYSFIRSVELRRLRLIVQAMLRTDILIAGAAGLFTFAGLTWFFSSRRRLFLRAFALPEESRDVDRSRIRDARFQTRLRAVARVELVVAVLFALVVLWCRA
jgi:hypothetical protein